MRSKTTIALACLLALPLAALAQEAASPDLSGTWVINEPLSETMREKIREKMEEDLAGNPRAQARWDRVQHRDRARLGNAPFTRLEIEHAEPRVAIKYLDGRLRELFSDGRALEPDAQRGERSVTASWQGVRLIVDAQTSRGRLTEFWELSDDGKRLFVTTEAEMGERFSGPVSYRHVYDLEPADGAMAPTEPSAEPDSEPDSVSDAETDSGSG